MGNSAPEHTFNLTTCPESRCVDRAQCYRPCLRGDRDSLGLDHAKLGLTCPSLLVGWEGRASELVAETPAGT
jgi:hypothetical protein